MADRFHIREWLNSKVHCGGAFIKARVPKNTVPKTEKAAENCYPDLDAFVEISDCSRKISLEFNEWGGDGVSGRRQNNIKKLDKLISVLCQFRKHLTEEQKVFDEAVKAKARLLKNKKRK